MKNISRAKKEREVHFKLIDTVMSHWQLIDRAHRSPTEFIVSVPNMLMKLSRILFRQIWQGELNIWQVITFETTYNFHISVRVCLHLLFASNLYHSSKMKLQTHAAITKYV